VGIKCSPLVAIFLFRYRGFGQRKPYLKTCVTGLRGHLNIASVFLHNSLNRVEAQTRSLPYSFGCEERFKDVRLDLRRNSGTVIADFHYNAPVIAISSDSKLALSAHRIDGVIDEIGPHLIKLAPE